MDENENKSRSYFLFCSPIYYKEKPGNTHFEGNSAPKPLCHNGLTVAVGVATGRCPQFEGTRRCVA